MWLDSLVEMKRESAKTLKQISEESGISLGTINKIFSGQTEDPKLETIKSIVYCLGFTLDDLEPPPKTKHPPAITPEALKLAKDFDSLDSWGKASTRTLVDSELKRCLEQTKERMEMEAANEFPATLLLLPRSEQPASAGTGMFLGPEDFETIYVRDNPLIRRASFGVPVSGDSMEPDYHDGDTLLVEAASDIRVGEVGVFTLDGQGYVKERGKDTLISLNPEYAPIPMDESVRCNGRVIGILDPEWIVEK